MPTAPRNSIVATGETYHVIARGSGQMTIFRDAEDYAFYLQLLSTGLKKFGIDMFHYVLMPNHFHLLMRPMISDLSACMHIVQLTYAKRFSKKYRRVGRIWQGRYKSYLIDSDGYLFASGNYIERNPVRAKLVDAPQEWKYSSYRYYAFGRKDRLVTRDPLYSSLGVTSKKRRREYRKQVAISKSEFKRKVKESKKNKKKPVPFLRPKAKRKIR
jgi:putative transposase